VTPSGWLAGAALSPEVAQQFPGYRVLLITAENLQPGPSDPISERQLSAAEGSAVERLAGRAPDQLPECAAWREAYRAFGAKPNRTRPSLEALLRRLDRGLPRIDRLTDTYNAVSLSCLLPVGGEDLAGYRGPPRLVRAAGDEVFDTEGPPDPGEIVWRDDAGVTCRRWNWRQCARTRLSTDTTSAVFVLDWLPAGAGQAPLEQTGDALVGQLSELSSDVRVSTRLLGA
jgi:DNA/RNA-binding domain of Phe-tRNA-synthetase-like protein